MPRLPVDVRRQRFIDAAVTVIARDGVDGATTRRIAEQAGVPLASLHYYVKAKQNLLWAVFERVADMLRAEIEERSPGGKALVEIAVDLLREGIRSAIDRPDANRAQVEIWLWAERNDPELASRLYDTHLDAWQEFLRSATSPLRPDELETVTRVILGVVDGLCLQLITHGEEAKIRRDVGTAAAMLVAFLEEKTTRVA